MKKLKLDLLENCFNFANESLIKAVHADTNKIEWKFSILFLVQSIELALKERLRKEHPSLIFKDVAKHTITVTIEQAIERLESISKLKFDSADRDNIKTAIIIRNKIVHYEIDEEFDTIKVIFTSLLGFLESFISKHLHETLRRHLKGDLWNDVLKIEEYVNEITKRAELKIIEEGIDSSRIWHCPKCRKITFVLDEKLEGGECYVCHWTDDIVICEGCHQLLFSEFAYSDYHDMDEVYCLGCYNDTLNDAEMDMYEEY